MRNFLILFQKEMNESVKNGKWIWLPIVLIIIGISQPLSMYYMPQILEAAGNLPEGAVIEMPTPAGEEVLLSVLSQYGMIGTLLFVLGTMGVISQERQNGSLTFVMARPVTPLQYVASKYSGQLCLLLVALLTSYCLSWYYTNLLFSDVSWSLMLGSFFIYGFWIVFTVAVTILAGTVLKSSGGIAGVSILFLSLLSLLTTVFPKYMKWSPASLRAESSVFLIEGEWLRSISLVVGSTAGLSALLFACAVIAFKRFERYGE